MERLLVQAGVIATGTVVAVMNIDGAFLGGIAAILSTFFTFILGVLALRRGQRESDQAEYWRHIADEQERLLLEFKKGEK